MRLRSLLVLIACCCASSTSAQQRAVRDDRMTVILHPNGRWQVASPPPVPPLAALGALEAPASDALRIESP